MPSAFRGRRIGCAPRAIAVAVVSVAFVSCRPADRTIETTVDAQIAVDRVTGNLYLAVSVADAVVQLDGEVLSLEQRRRAVDIARAVHGVKQVVDNTYLNDDVLIAAVRKALASDPVVGSIPVEVDSERGVISLRSTQTNKPQRTRLVELASNVEGVKRVEDAMR